ncbi:DUF4148 domain-containing protein [Caballeronia sp. LZ034LL]|uniref:DUF4148 domain-containing protein n=1 Tax=Caballeronia sp. LZ034LL TaxID=3038567 RepID=UPI0028544CA3|nr:DUF4148 domain-containing protein [Caballeronia sp. LZ034LL]MDR5837464.1 DUF4148 domain-containing protein [Caballeronia sp. LZ034LL]
MKSLVRVVIALAVAAPAIAFAQASSQPLTRAQVRADLVQAEKAGYSPTAWAYFPEGEMQAAEFHKAAHQAAVGGYGADWNGVSQAGAIAR